MFNNTPLDTPTISIKSNVKYYYCEEHVVLFSTILYFSFRYIKKKKIGTHQCARVFTIRFSILFSLTTTTPDTRKPIFVDFFRFQKRFGHVFLNFFWKLVFSSVLVVILVSSFCYTIQQDSYVYNKTFNYCFCFVFFFLGSDNSAV